MSQATSIPLDEGGSLYVEVGTRDDDGWTRAGRTHDAAGPAGRTLRLVLEPGVAVARTAAVAGISVLVERHRPAEG
ncbi:hypothetical protein [Streptomyces misionensis]|uniref:hypothetical protein n=1 Tax=Streptomyces misionensis TaxID=67331 RepID=UPI0036FFB2ED